MHATLARMTQPPHRFNLNMPPDRVAGHYADFAAIWHTPETFVLDFIATAQPAHPDPEMAGGFITDAEVVTRVRIPAAQVWEIMKALEQQYSAWEIENGQRSPGSGEGLPPTT
jgi:hypothetical protein